MLLQDLGSVQTLDGADHHERKQAFMTLLEAGAVRRLVEATQGCTCSAWDTVA